MKRFLEQSLPPGYIYKTEFFAVLGAFSWAALSSLIRFFSAYSSERQALFIRRGTDLILDESRIMPDFIYVLGDKLLGHIIFAVLILVGASVIHYAYYHSGSKSIYLMRRLPNKHEMHRRCLLIPLITAFVFVIMAAVLLLIYYAVYMNFTPEVCLAPDQWQKILGVQR